MHTEDLIGYLQLLKRYLNEKGVKKAGYAYGGEPITYTSEPIDEIIKRLKILEELKRKEIEMESTGQMVKELLELFLYQDTVDRMDSKDKLIKVYRVNPNLVRVDIKIKEGENKS